MTRTNKILNKIKRARWIILPVLFVCLFIILSISSVSYAKYYKEFVGTNSANIAVMASDVVVDFNFSDINLKPGAEITIPVNIINKKNGHISHVRQGYTMSVTSLSNIPLQITILNEQGTQVASPSGTFEAGVLDMHSYQIKIVWDASDNDYNLAYEVDVIRIIIDSSQLDGE